MSSEFLDLSLVSIIYQGEFLSSVPKTYKAFLESLRDKEGITNEEFCKRTIWRGDFPILTKADYLILLKTKGVEGIFEVDLVKTDEEDENLFGEKDYKQFLEMTEPEEEIKIKIKDEEEIKVDLKEDNIDIKSEVNEFYAITEVTQYYKNYNKTPVELSIIYPLKKEINFRKFTINVNGKKSVSKI